MLAAMALLSAGYAALAIRLQEASNAGSGLTSSDVRARLADAIRDHYRGTSTWGYYMDHIGDGESGDVIFSCSDDTMIAPYEISGGEGTSAKCVIDFDDCTDVVPRTIYEPEAEEEDHYAAMTEAMVTKAKLYTELPLYERFISKKERDDADDSDFAGKGRSFPILKPEDVAAAAHSIGRAGSDNIGPSGIKNRIISIAKRKGAAYVAKLPKAWKTADATEADRPSHGGLRLVESCGDLGLEMLLREGAGDGASASPYRTKYPIRIITPGVGSSANYSESLLRKAADEGKFDAGLMMYWNHPTAAQEASRPEGNLDDLAAITTTKGVWMDNGPKGKGVYAEAKVMADYAQKVSERAPHIGLSIRAGGTASGRMVEGKPDLASIDYVESVDYVTKAGRGGLALAEAARGAGLLDSVSPKEVSMDATEVQRLIKEALAPQQATTTLLLEGEMKRTAIGIGAKALAGLDLPAVSKQRVIEAVVSLPIPRTADGNAPDAAKLSEAFVAEAKREGAYLAQLMGGGRVTGLGPTAVPQLSAEESARRAEADKAQDAMYLNVMESLMGDKTAARFAFQGRQREDAA
jgi:hypothetical protein